MGIISYLWGLCLKHPKQSSTGDINKHVGIKVGLKTLIDPSSHAPQIVHSCTDGTTAWRRPAPPPSLMFRSLATDDVIGTESGDYMSSSSVEDLKVVVVDKAEPPHRNNQTRSKYRKGEKRDFPPPIAILTHMGGMPWVFRKELAIDGRLIMRAEIMKRHHCFEAHRLDGRLTLKLLPPQYDAVSCDDECGHPITDDEQSEDDECQGVDVEECEELCKCMECEEDLGPFWKGKAIKGPNGCLGGPSSTPPRPMTTVV